MPSSESKRHPLEYWHALVKPKTCPTCGYVANGSVRLWLLLEAPIDCKCLKCGAQWSCAIPMGDCDMRRDIQSILAAEKRYYVLTEELNQITNKLHGRSK